MDKLYPIIRRKRRPLVVEDVPPMPTKVLADCHQSMPVQPVVKTPKVEPAVISKSDDGQNISNPESE
jgi:hypothetical protein